MGAALARRLGVPFRSAGGFNASKLPDAQAAYEAANTLQNGLLAGVNFMLHTAHGDTTQTIVLYMVVVGWCLPKKASWPCSPMPWLHLVSYTRGGVFNNVVGGRIYNCT